MQQAKTFFDTSEKTLSEKITRAAEYYKKKYKTPPDVCFVNPAMLDGTQDKAPVTTKVASYLATGIIWAGLDDSRKLR